MEATVTLVIDLSNEVIDGRSDADWAVINSIKALADNIDSIDSEIPKGMTMEIKYGDGK